MVSFARFCEVVVLLVDPIRFLFLSASFIPTTIAHLVRTNQYTVLFSPSAFHDAWFAQFWSRVGPNVRLFNTPRVAPMLALAEGVVLDIGPGTGEWAALFDKNKVTRILGVEPNRDCHARLLERVRAAGLEDIYEIIPVGVEDLGDRWVKMGEVDTIVTNHCLCSMDDPKSMITVLYTYLKPGGQWIVYEHVKAYSYQGWALGLYQKIIDIVWPTFLGGCSLTRETIKWLSEVGSWESFELKQPKDEDLWNMVPKAMGILKK